MRSINHLYNACHIKRYYDCGLESVSAVLKLAWFQDSHAALGPPLINLSMGAVYACWCVSECKFESGSCALSLMDLTCTGRVDAKDSFGEFSQWRFWSRQWAKCLTYALIKQHSIVVQTTPLNTAGLIPSNRPVESWITPAHIVLPGSLTGVGLQHALTQENRKPQSSRFLVVDFGVAAHVQWAPETCVSKTHTDQLLGLCQTLF